MRKSASWSKEKKTRLPYSLIRRACGSMTEVSYAPEAMFFQPSCFSVQLAWCFSVHTVDSQASMSRRSRPSSRSSGVSSSPSALLPDMSWYV